MSYHRFGCFRFGEFREIHVLLSYDKTVQKFQDLTGRPTNILVVGAV